MIDYSMQTGLSRSMGNACIAIHIMFSPAIMHGHAWRAQPPMGLKGGSGDGGVRSYQVPSKVQGEARYACEGRSVHAGAWGCMGQIQQA
jgi:hypothetical protein